ncbi:MAG: Cell division ATP-binding protein ftsE [Candidatus Magnetoglobus multicellularis str. Araruama]|uniref:Cell division ATP-binding protein FtsE n=1 Tax=Candidatus Magnetoglobus multicellularis str. Araruama TaxID=890399 RepID=A0A1V1PD39_9BACT|nr:MAG: Cell division ATP-binding protein ftsE [Candidatus Magnetoglobus multicellularis str. Araruama]
MRVNENNIHMFETEKDYIIQMYHVYKQFGEKDVICDVSMNVIRNEFLFISGPSGAGKSTMLKLLYAGERLSKGQIIMDGLNLVRLNQSNIHRLRRRIGIIFQDFKLIQTRSVFDNVALVLETQGFPRRLIERKVNTALTRVGMTSFTNAFPPSLSGGEQQRVAVARAMASEPSIIFADEPTGSLDPDSASIILALLDEYHHYGGTVLFATHDISLIQHTRRRVVFLNDGHINENGQPPFLSRHEETVNTPEGE